MVLVQVLGRQNNSSSACNFATTMLPSYLAMHIELRLLPKVGHPGITALLCQACYCGGYYSAISLGCKRLSAAADHQVPPQNLTPSALSQSLNPIQLCQRSRRSSAAIPILQPATWLPSAGDAPCLYTWASLQAWRGSGCLQACRQAQAQAQRCNEFTASKTQRCGKRLLRHPEAWLTIFQLDRGKLWKATASLGVMSKHKSSPPK